LSHYLWRCYARSIGFHCFLRREVVHPSQAVDFAPVELILGASMSDLRPCACLVFALLVASSGRVVANDCSCQTIMAFGHGNTSCSASELNSRCTIDYNLFSPVAEGRAAEMLRAAGLSTLQAPPPGTSVQALFQAEQAGQKALVDAVMVYLLVGAADHSIDTGQNLNEVAADIVRVLSTRTEPSVNDRIADAFTRATAERWLNVPDDQLRDGIVPKAERFADNRITRAPGCIEVRLNHVWVMFKISWSAMRRMPRCGE
jgi:hypothetical protein